MLAEHQTKPVKISVLITNYNYAQYLGQCLDSIFKQDYPHKEVVVVDDGSADASKQVIEGYAEPVVAIFKENGGQTSAFNAGIRVCTGEIVVCVDADDYLLPGTLSLYAAKMRNAEIVKLQGFLQVVDGRGVGSGKQIPGRKPGEGNLRSQVLEYGPGSYVAPPTSGNAWRKSFLDAVAPLPESSTIRGALDAYLMDTAPLFGTVATIDQAVGAYREHGAGVSQARGALTLKNIRKNLARYESRSAFLQQTAAAMGVEVAVSKWQKCNWRVLTLYFLMSRLDAASPAPALTEHLFSPFKAKTTKKLTFKLALMMIIGLIRSTPTRTALLITSKMINMKYL